MKKLLTTLGLVMVCGVGYSQCDTIYIELPRDTVFIEVPAPCEACLLDSNQDGIINYMDLLSLLSQMGCLCNYEENN